MDKCYHPMFECCLHPVRSLPRRPLHPVRSHTRKQEALLALIHDAFAANHPVNSPPPSPRRSRELSSAPEEEEQRQEEMNSRVSRPEIAKTQEQHSSQSRQPTAPSHQGEWKILICSWP
ncbi:UNVERIFIED_CONTAM: hypothetical protein Slati_3533500 [Sesamum latifolium]|uniref:Uncharacterized protein n=1 Tax=Sesamum latifolium TaxID=2727402 RepID=A0AAW2ULV3_9LAMI